MREDEVRKAVRDRYGSIAREGSTGCGCGCGCDPSGQEWTTLTIGQTIGYETGQLAILS